MPNPIPTSKAEAVRQREQGLCLRCGLGGSETHHRRTRRVADPHQHCTCNLVRLCRTCHSWTHTHPFEARGQGLMVSRHEPAPWKQIITTHQGRAVLHCSGAITLIGESA